MQTEVVVCTKCGETWSETEWIELPLVGVYDQGTEGKIELRTCVCGATLSIPLATKEPRE